ncbi:MAG: leucine-rich repeat protein, partial [Prevotella sp.]|nr:leucine-rich repeat protein [Prevotella sp.]
MNKNNLFNSFSHPSLTPSPSPKGEGSITGLRGSFPSGRRLLMALVALLGSITASAYDFSAENAQGQTFYYNITGDNTVEVTNNGGNYIYRDVIIPSTVEYNEKTYTVTGIGACAFMSSFITSITLPNTITKIGGRAFEYCDKLSCLTIPENVTYLGESAFGEYPKIQKLYYNARNAECGHSDTWNSLGLESGALGHSSHCEVIFGENVEVIPAYLLCNNHSKNINIPSGITSIGRYAFSGCDSLTNIVIPQNVTTIGYCAFEDCRRLTTVIAKMTTPADVSNSFPDRSSQTLYVPVGTLTNYVMANHWKEFKEILEINRITFQDSNVEAICVQNWDTNGDGYLDVVEASLVSDIGTTFERKSGITSFNELQYFKGLRSIPDNAFNGCSSLTAITMPNQVTSIGESAFQGCVSLQAFDFTAIKIIGDNAFQDCSRLSTLTSLSNVTNIGESAFANCTSLTTVDLNASAIKSNTFQGCTNLTSVTLGSKVTDIKEGAFKNCRALTSVNIPGSVISLNGNCFEGCTYLKTVTLNAGTKYITDEAFKGCSSLKTVTLPNGLVYIGQRVFQNTSLETIDIPSSVTNIQSNAFVDCAKLKLVTVNWTTPLTVIASAFPDRANQTLLVPEGTKATYKAANVWKDFNLIAEPGDVLDFPYAIYNATAHSLTFYNDGQALSKSGMLIYMPEGTATPEWQDYRADITTVTFDESFTTFQPTTTARWFNGFNELTTINGLTNLNTSQVTTMQAMFQSCFKLTQCDVSGFNTANVTNMSSMFSYCRLLPSIDVSGFNTVKVTTMYAMFQGCNVVTTLDLSSFNTAKVTDMRYMFDECSALKTIMVGSGWSTTLVTSSDDMFAACTKLVGGKGTTYNVNYRDKTYARVDGGYSNPGYLTDKGSPYAVLSTDGKTLTFYADGKRLQHTEQTYSLNDSSSDPDWCTYPSSITTVVFDASMASARPTNTNCWFASMDKLTTITGMEYLNTSEVTDMNQMFYDCEKLTSLDLSHFNTSKVTNMEGMFNDCSSLTSLDLSSFNTSNVDIMNDMFNGCSSLVNLNLSSFNTSKVTHMSGMFAECSSLVELNLNSFNTSNVRYMNYLFYNCSSLTTVSVGDGWDASRASTDDMFFHCYSIVGELGTTYTAYGENVGEDAAHIDTEDYPGYFVSADYLTVPYALLSADKKTLTLYHDGQRGTHRTQKTYSINMADNEDPGWYLDESMYEITQVVIDPSFADARPTSTYYWFGQMNVLNGITGMEFLNTSEVTNMASMFEECLVLTSLDVSHFDTKKVKNMAGMFNGCNELTALDVSGFDTRNVTNMYGMFQGCNNLTAIDVRNFDTQKVTNMNSMFWSCNSLTSLDVSFLNTANVTNMGYMFGNCENLTNLDLWNFNTAKVTDMSHMFHGCTNMRTICVGDGWSTANVAQSGYMFTSCTNLVGGSGTVFASTHVDKEYARVDGGTSAPGYFVDLSYNDTPYALLSADGTTLTFYRDSQRLTRSERTYNLNEGENAPDWRNDGSYEGVTNVVFDESFAQARPTTTASWFAGMTNLTTITGIENLNTSEVTSMRSMFFN